MAVICGDLDSTNALKDTDDTLSALQVGKKKFKKTDEHWVSTKVSVLEEILENKCVQVPVFSDKLCTSKQSTTFGSVLTVKEHDINNPITGRVNTLGVLHEQ